MRLASTESLVTRSHKPRQDYRKDFVSPGQERQKFPPLLACPQQRVLKVLSVSFSTTA